MTDRSEMFSGINSGSNVQEQIPSAFRSVAVCVKSTRKIVDQAFSVPKCARLAEESYELLCKIFSAVPERTREELELVLGKKFMGYASGNFSDFE